MFCRLTTLAKPAIALEAPQTTPISPLQRYLSKLLTEDLPRVMVLPKRLEINIPPSISSIAEAAVGRDAVMKSLARAVFQADVLEQAL